MILPVAFPQEIVSPSSIERSTGSTLGIWMPNCCACAGAFSYKNPSAAFHYPARYDSMNAYKLGGHQHVCEIERELGAVADSEIKVTFTAQIVPVCRGIMSSLYGRVDGATSEKDAVAVYSDFYADSPFVRVYDSTSPVVSAHVRGTNYCNLTVTVDERTGQLRVISYIDNLVKGQAGSALQNMNLLFGLPETTGLDRPSRYP